MNTLLWHNNAKRPLETAIKEVHPERSRRASAVHLRRLGSQPTHVILPLGEYPETVGGLKVVTCRTVKGNFMKVYAENNNDVSH